MFYVRNTGLGQYSMILNAFIYFWNYCLIYKQFWLAWLSLRQYDGRAGYNITIVMGVLYFKWNKVHPLHFLYSLGGGEEMSDFSFFSNSFPYIERSVIYGNGKNTCVSIQVIWASID